MSRSKSRTYEYSIDGRVERIPPRVEDMVRAQAEASVVLKVWPAPDLCAIFRLWTVEQIDFDVDLREFQGRQQLNAVGRAALGEPVPMSPEGYEIRPVIGYQPTIDRIVVLMES